MEKPKKISTISEYIHKFLDKISDSYENNPHLRSLILDEAYFKNILKKNDEQWRKTIIFGIENRIPVPVLSSCLQFFDSMR